MSLKWDKTKWPPSKWDEHPDWQMEFVRASALISEERKFIFIHIGKTAGQSMVRGVFLKYIKDAVNSPYLDYPISSNVWDDYFKFTFVRNPWDRMVSCYHLPVDISGRYSTGDQPSGHNLPKRLTPQAMSFEDFISKGAWDENGDPYNRHWLNCSKFIHNFDESWVDFVGKFETLEDDWKYIRKTIGIDYDLPHMNKRRGSKKDYRSYYNDKTRSIVADKFKDDIDMFGYEFL